MKDKKRDRQEPRADDDVAADDDVVLDDEVVADDEGAAGEPLDVDGDGDGDVDGDGDGTSETPRAAAPLDTDAEPTTPTTEPRGGKREVVLVMSPRKLLVAFAAAVVLAALVLLALQWRRADDRANDLARERDDRQAVSLVASDFVRTLLTRDVANPTANLDHLKSLATTRYAPTIDEGRDNVANQPPTSAPEAQASTSAEVDKVFVTDLSRGSANAVCVVRWFITTGGQTAPLGNLYMEFDLKYEDGAWKIDESSAFGLRQEQGSPVPTTPPDSTTTVPPGSTPDTSSGG